MTKKYWTILAAIIIAELAIALFVDQALTRSRLDLRVDMLSGNEASSVAMQRDLTSQIFRQITGDLIFLNEMLVESFDEYGPETSKISMLFLQFIRAKGIYDQVRFLDMSGAEVVRVNAGPGKPSIVPADKLQDKSRRYYFKDTVTLPRGEIFISPLDLNIENGRIEQPLKPMIRFGAPVFDDAGNRRGALMLNYLAANLLMEMERHALGASGRIILLNPQGDRLLGPEPSKNWGFMYPDREGMTFQADYPAAWNVIKDGEEGQFRTDLGLFTFATLRPLRLGMRFVSSSSSGAADAPSEKPLSPDEYVWKLVSVVNAGGLSTLEGQVRRGLAVPSLAIFSLAAIITLLVFLGYARNNEFARRMLKAKQAADAANAAKSRFLAMMSHEIRTPMNSVLNMTSLALDSPLTLAQRQWLETSTQAANHLLGIIDDILDVSRIESGQFQLSPIVFDPAALFKVCISSFEPQAASKGVRLAADISPDLPVAAEGDPGRIRQITSNLLSNALKFTQKGGVTMRVKVLEEAAVPGPGAPFTLVLQVADTGIGIPGNMQDAVFSLFKQADDSVSRRFGGAGLGLAIVRQLAELMGGDVALASKPGQGSVFTVRLPLRAADPADIDPTGLSEAACALPPPLTVLAVEDNADNRAVAKALLSRLRQKAALAESGPEALRLLRENAFDLVLMDVEMPGMDGLETTRRIREGEAGEAARNVRIAAMTAHVLPDYREACLRAGMDDFIPKPVDIKLLRQVLVKAGRTRPVRAAPPGADGGSAAGPESPQRPEPLRPEPLRPEALREEAAYGLPVLNKQAALDRLEDDEFYEYMAGELCQRFEERLEELRGFIREGRAGDLVIKAHSLKGVLGVVGAERAADAAYRLERLARTGELEGAIALVENLGLEFDEVRAALDAGK